MNTIGWLPSIGLVDAVFCLRLTVTLLHFLWQGAVIGLLLLLASRRLCRVPARVRYAVNVVAMLLMAACLPVTFALVSKPKPDLPRAAETSDGRVFAEAHRPATQPSLEVPAPGVDLSRAGGPLTAEESAASADLTTIAAGPSAEHADADRVDASLSAIAPYTTIAYLCGVAVMILRLGVALWGGHRLQRSATPVRDADLLSLIQQQARRVGMKAAPAIAYCGRIAAPVVIGVLKPAILLPASLATGLGPDQVLAIVTHELAHIRRLDLLVNLLQRLIEAVLFFHPAVWYVSRNVSIERESACDDLVVASGWQRARYADALVRMAEFCAVARGGSPAGQAALVSASGGSRSQFNRRVLRLLYGEPVMPLKLNRAGIAALTFGLLFLFLMPLVLQAFADFGPQAPPPGEGRDVNAVAEDGKNAGWGEASGGLRIRVVPIAPTDDEESFDIEKRVSQFDHADDLTLAVEIQNVSEKPVKLQGTRYGNNVTPPWPGRSVSNLFAPFLFDCEFFDKAGRPVERPERETSAVDMAILLHGGSVETLEPGKSLMLLLRPTQWRHAFEHDLDPGEHRVRITYHGPSEPARKQIAEGWKENEIAVAWSGSVTSGEASLRIAADPSRKPAKLVWGEPVNGLRAAVEFLAAPPGQKRPFRSIAESVAVPHGSRLRVRLHIQNVSNDVISFWSDTWRQEDRVFVIDEAGNEQELHRGWYTGWATMVRWKLKPAEVAKLEASALGVAADAESAKKSEHPVGPILAGKPGKYQLRYSLRFGSVQRKDRDGKVLVPGPGDWTGSLTTGLTPLSVRQRRPDDEPPTFTARLRFRWPEGKPADAGEVTVRVQEGGHEVFKGEFSGGVLSVPKCPFETLTVSVRAPGFEEARLYDVKVKPNQVTSLTLTPAEPLRFRLVSRDDGKPVAGARVRYFNRSKQDATVGPYPTAGLNGPVWAASDADGSVVLDTLQKIDPYDTKLGNNIYYFYIEPADLAPLFIGPVQAGQDLGEIEVGPILEVRGEVRGTKEELDNFAAEWDQPEPMKRGDGTVGWHYAESKKLATRRDGDRLKFHLTGLRPGKLRIVSNFQPGRRSTRHTFSRREPGPGDVVFEIDLTESRDDVVVTNKP